MANGTSYSAFPWHRDLMSKAKVAVIRNQALLDHLWGKGRHPSETLQALIPEVCFRLGAAYEFGAGVKISPIRAECCYHAAARRGHVRAMVFLGALHWEGKCPGTAKLSSRYSAAAKWYRRAIRVGLAQGETPEHLGKAAYCLGRLYTEATDWLPSSRKGPRQGVPPDRDQAIAWWRKAAQWGNKDAVIKLTRTFYTLRNYAETVRWIRQGIAMDIPESLFNMGEVCTLGHGVERSLEQAMLWFHRAALKGHHEAIFSLCLAYRDGFGVPRSIPEARHCLNVLLQRYWEYFSFKDLLAPPPDLLPPDPEEALRLYTLGENYWSQEVPRYDEGVQLFRKAALLGNARAQLRLALIYEFEDAHELSPDKATQRIRAAEARWEHGIPKRTAYHEHAAAEPWYHLAAEQGLPEAQCHLAMFYRRHLPSHACFVWHEWFHKAAEQGFAPAQYEQTAFLNQQSAPEAKTEAWRWAQKAARQDYFPAQLCLVISLLKTETPKAFAEAMEWCRRVAKRGDQKACETIANVLLSYRKTPNHFEATQAFFHDFADRISGKWHCIFARHLLEQHTPQADEAAEERLRYALAHGYPDAQSDLDQLLKRRNEAH